MNEPVILLVEDNPDDEALVVAALRRNGIKVRLMVAHDGIEALDFLQGGKHPLPSLVLLDLKMPRMTGLEVLERLKGREDTKLITVVVFTSSGEEQDVLKSYELGASSFVRKPIDFGEFSSAVVEVVTYWTRFNRGPAAKQVKTVR